MVYSSVKERDHLARIYTEVLDMVPGFHDQMPNFGTDPEALDSIIDMVSSGENICLNLNHS